MSSEHVVSIRLPSAWNSKVSHTLLYGLVLKQRRRAVQARCRSSHEPFHCEDLPIRFVIVRTVTDEQSMNIQSSGSLNGAVTANVVCSILLVHESSTKFDLPPTW